MKIAIDINPGNKTFCDLGDKQCKKLHADNRLGGVWCIVFDKELDVYGGSTVRCTECHEAEREAKNDCKNNTDA